ncbi:MAG TPA: Slp family lipoprotein [Dongiaceae bacterium]|nr:Slp family lipoprotein [Dongiaceae bacterium]
MRVLLLLAATALCLAGCAPVISNQSLRSVDRGLSFAELRQDPDRHMGRHLLLAGGIAEVRNTNEGGELELVQFAADENGKITDTASSGGRFIARSSGFLDPAVYRSGLLVTLVGEVQGKKTMLLGDVVYTYPVLAIREIHLWQPEELPGPPKFHFGIGIGTIIR